MKVATKQGHVDLQPHRIVSLMALVEASATDSFTADVAKRLFLAELREDLAMQLPSVGFEDELGRTGQWVN